MLRYATEGNQPLQAATQPCGLALYKHRCRREYRHEHRHEYRYGCRYRYRRSLPWPRPDLAEPVALLLAA